MAKFNLRLKELRTKRGISQQKLADKVAMSKSSINMYERGEREPGLETLEAFADYFNVDLDYLIGKSDIPNKAVYKNEKLPSNVTPIDNMKFVKIPVIGRVAAGIQCFADMDIVDYDFLPADSIADGEKYVFLRVVGDSMYPDIKEGDSVLVRCQSSIDSGSIAVVNIDNEDGVVKKVVYDSDWVELRSINPMYPPRRFEGADVQRVRVFGLVRKVVRNYN